MNLLISLTPQGRAAKIATAIIGRLGRVGKIIINRAGQGKPPLPPKKPRLQEPKPNPLTERPKNVPKDWVARPTKSGKGTIYQHPTEKGTYVKVEKGNPNASQPGQRYDNVRVQKNGQSYDINGNKVPQQSQESHIPLKDFKFDPRLFK